MPTLHDVARHAGVSIATVSRVLRNLPSVTPETRERVLLSVDALGYAPNPIGQALRAGHINAVALLVGDIGQGWYASLTRDMQVLLEREGMDLVLFNLGRSESRLNEVVERVISLRLRAVALATSDQIPSATIARIWRRLAEAGIVFIAIGHRVDGLGMPSIVYDDEEAGARAVSHLAQRGFAPIAYMGRIEKSMTGQVRFAGYLRGLIQNGLERDPSLEWSQTDSFRFTAGYNTMLDVRRRGVNFRSLIASSDELALGAMAAALDLKLRVPEDVAIIGFSGLEWAGYVRPALTTLDADTAAIAEQFSIGLKSALAGSSGSISAVIPRRLVLRDSA